MGGGGGGGGSKGRWRVVSKGRAGGGGCIRADCGDGTGSDAGFMTMSFLDMLHLLVLTALGDFSEKGFPRTMLLVLLLLYTYRERERGRERSRVCDFCDCFIFGKNLCLKNFQ